jgi:hypothetical protein
MGPNIIEEMQSFYYSFASWISHEICYVNLENLHPQSYECFANLKKVGKSLTHNLCVFCN